MAVAAVLDPAALGVFQMVAGCLQLLQTSCPPTTAFMGHRVSPHTLTKTYWSVPLGSPTDCRWVIQSASVVRKAGAGSGSYIVSRRRPARKKVFGEASSCRQQILRVCTPPSLACPWPATNSSRNPLP